MNSTKNYIEEFMNHKIYFSNISYSCPSLKLFGYRELSEIRRAIKIKLKKYGIITVN